MGYRIVFHSQAKEDFENASIWYEDKSAGLGLRFEQNVNLKLD